MRINIREEKGEHGLNGLIELTKPKQEKNTIIKEFEDLGVFD